MTTDADKIKSFAQEFLAEYNSMLSDKPLLFPKMLLEAVEALETLKTRWEKVGAHKTTSHEIVERALARLAGRISNG